MIAHLRGRLLTKDPNRAVVEAAGVGYELAISVPTYSELPNAGAEVALHVHTHVREDAIALFGFLRTVEKRLFERLIAVSGIGPKLAITILSGMSAEFLVAAIRGNDLAALTKVPGIGKKTAERMVVELRDRAADLGGGGGPLGSGSVPMDPQSEATVALQQLGYKPAEAARMVRDAAATGDDAATIIRKALKSALR